MPSTENTDIKYLLGSRKSLKADNTETSKFAVASYSYNKFKKKTGLYTQINGISMGNPQIDGEGFLLCSDKNNYINTGLSTVINSNVNKRDTFELVGSFTTNGQTNATGYLFTTLPNNEIRVELAKGDIKATIYSGSTSITIPSAKQPAVKAIPNTIYLFRLSYDKQYLKFEYSTNNGNDWILIGSSVEYSSTIKISNLTVGSYKVGNVVDKKNTLGGIDLTKCYLKVNGITLWEGTQSITTRSHKELEIANYAPSAAGLTPVDGHNYILTNFADGVYVRAVSKLNPSIITDNNVIMDNKYPAILTCPTANAEKWTAKIKFILNGTPTKTESLIGHTDKSKILALVVDKNRNLVLYANGIKNKSAVNTPLNIGQWYSAKIKYDGTNGYRLFLSEEIRKQDTNWQDVPSQSSTVNNNLKSIAFGKDIYVSVGEDGFIGSWSDPELTAGAIVWNKHVLSDFSSGDHLNSVIFGEKQFIAVGDHGKVVTSYDGQVWITKNNVISSGFHLTGIAYGNEKFIAVGHDGQNGVIFSTTDGSEWEKIEIDDIGKLNYITYGNGQFITVGNNGTFGRSYDGINWEFGAVVYYDDNTQMTTVNFHSAISTTDGILICGDSGVVLRYTNDLGWQNKFIIDGSELIRQKVISPEWQDGVNWNSVIYENGQYRLLGNAGRTGYSTDMITWNFDIIGDVTRVDYNDCIYANDMLVAIGNGGYSNYLQYWIPKLEGVVKDSKGNLLTSKVKDDTINLGGKITYKSGDETKTLSSGLLQGTIDLSGCEVKVNGFTWWEGTKKYTVNENDYDERIKEVVRYI